MRACLTAMIMLACMPGFAVRPVAAAEMISEYTDIDVQKTCSTSATSEDGDDSGVSICPGWRGYPVILSFGDLRESIFYGFPPIGGDPAWESFSGFNSAGPKIEWRIEKDGGRETPLAAIHRWSVNADPEDAGKKTEVLVVEKVGQLGVAEGCTVGLVVATGNPKANETARRIADEQARDFACSGDERVVVGGDVPMPDFDRQEK